MQNPRLATKAQGRRIKAQLHGQRYGDEPSKGALASSDAKSKRASANGLEVEGIMHEYR
jgi:hypothetical protein